MHEKHPEFVAARALQGILLSHEFQTETFGDAVATIPAGKEGASFSIFSSFYATCFRENAKRRNRLLSSLANALDFSSSAFPASFALSEYVAHTLCALPYATQNEVLHVIFEMDRIASLKAPHWLETANRCASEGAAENLVQGGYKLALLLRASAYLKECYGVSKQRVEEYNPVARTRAGTKRSAPFSKAPSALLPAGAVTLSHASFRALASSDILATITACVSNAMRDEGMIVEDAEAHDAGRRVERKRKASENTGKQQSKSKRSR